MWISRDVPQKMDTRMFTVIYYLFTTFNRILGC